MIERRELVVWEQMERCRLPLISYQHRAQTCSLAGVQVYAPPLEPGTSNVTRCKHGAAMHGAQRDRNYLMFADKSTTWEKRSADTLQDLEI